MTRTFPDSSTLQYIDQLLTSRDISTESFTTADIQIFYSDDTWTKPASDRYSAVRVIAIGGGGGGASGSKDDGTTNGGGGGGGGGLSDVTFSIFDISATVAIVIGQGGARGPGTAVAGDHASVSGSSGTNTTFGAYATAGKGFGGSGRNGGSGGVGDGDNGGSGGDGGDGGLATNGRAGDSTGESGPVGAAGGGGGGSYQNRFPGSNLHTIGGNGGTAWSALTGGPHESWPNNNGEDSDPADFWPGAGGGGGDASAAAGGDAGVYGGGGGGGGGGSSASGNGGNGADGVCVVVTY